MTSIELQVVGKSVRITVADQRLAATLASYYTAFLHTIPDGVAEVIEIRVRKGTTERTASVETQGRSEKCCGLADIIYAVEKTIAIEIQTRRPELFFLHAAALGFGNRCLLIVGESGAGKSTLCWMLSCAKLGYLSDELAPVDLETLHVEPYPRPIGIKRVVRGMPGLPDSTIRADSMLHIPAQGLPGGVEPGALCIDTVICLEKPNGCDEPGVAEIGTAEAAARLYANGLNQLAHERDGLTAARKIAANSRCFRLSRGRLGRMGYELSRVVGL